MQYNRMKSCIENGTTYNLQGSVAKFENQTRPL